MRKALFFLGILNDADLEWLLAIGRQEDIATGTVLIQEGTPIEALYLVLDGAFSVSAAKLGRQEIARLRCGEVVGEISFVDARLPSATVQAVVPSRVFVISRQHLATKLAHDPHFAARFYHALAVFLADRLRRTTSQLGYGKSEPRMTETADEDELSPTVLEWVSLAGTRLDWMLRRLRDAPLQET